MRRSAIRQALVAIVEGVTVPAEAQYGGVSSLAATKSPDVTRAIEASDHLVFSVELGAIEPASRGADGDTVRCPGVAQFVYRLHDGIDNSGKWADIDTANDLLEDVVAALVSETAADFDLTLTRAELLPAGERDDFVVGDIQFLIVHSLGA